jgi:hypothetical protein
MVELGYFKHTTFEFPISFGSSYTIVSYFIDDLIIAPKINYSANQNKYIKNIYKLGSIKDLLFNSSLVNIGGRKEGNSL